MCVGMRDTEEEEEEEEEEDDDEQGGAGDVYGLETPETQPGVGSREDQE